MKSRRGQALLLALAVVVLAGAAAATALRWATVQQQAAAGWRTMARRTAGAESAVAAWLAGDSVPPAQAWGIVDSFVGARFGGPDGGGQLEVVCRLAPSPPAAGPAACIAARGYLRTVR